MANALGFSLSDPNPVALVDSVRSRESVERLQVELLKMPQYEPKTTHHFHGGVYCREVYRDAGVLVVGRVHKREHFYQIVSGTVLVTQEGEPPKKITGPALIKSAPGTKRAVLALTPTTCMTWHATAAETPEEAEAELVSDERGAYDAFNNVLPGMLRREPKESLK